MKHWISLLLALALCLSLAGAALASEETMPVAEGPAADAEPEGLPIDAESFPDEDFRAYVRESFDKDEDGYLSDEEKLAVREIELRITEVDSVRGIEFFPELVVLNLWADFGDEGTLSEIDLSGNTKLRDLTVGFCALAELDVSMLPELESLFTGYSKLTKLDLSHNPKLRQLICSDSALASIDLTGCEALAVLDCCGNPDLTYLDISSCPALVADYQAGGRHAEWMLGLSEELYNSILVYGYSEGGFHDYNMAVNVYTTIYDGSAQFDPLDADKDGDVDTFDAFLWLFCEGDPASAAAALRRASGL